MKQFLKYLAPVAMAAATLVATHASAGPVFFADSTGNTNQNQFVGNYNPNTNDFGGFRHDGLDAFTFTDNWIFSVAPSGMVTTNANFLPLGSITDFLVQLYAVSSPLGCMTNGCNPGAVTVGALIASAGPADNPTIGFTNIMAGNYLVRVSGTAGGAVGGTQSQYSGQLQLAPAPTVPEPGSVALVGIALLGAAGALAKRRKA